MNIVRTLKQNLQLMDQDVTIMSEGSELANRAFVGTATHTDSEGTGSTEESRS